MHRSLHRPNLILGGERELIIVTGALSLGLAVTALNLVAGVVGASIWFFCIGALRMMAKIDPVLSKVYFRQLRFQRYYAARSTPWCRH